MIITKVERIMSLGFGENKRINKKPKLNIDKLFNQYAYMESHVYINSIMKLHARHNALMEKDLNKISNSYNSYSESVSFVLMEFTRQLGSYFRINKSKMIVATQNMLKRRIKDIENETNIEYYYVAKDFVDYLESNPKTFIKSKKNFNNENYADLLVTYLSGAEFINSEINKQPADILNKLNLMEGVKNTVSTNKEIVTTTTTVVSALLAPISIWLAMTGHPIIAAYGVFELLAGIRNIKFKSIASLKKINYVKVKKDKVIAVLNSLIKGFDHVKEMHETIESKINNSESKLSKEEYGKIKLILQAWRKSIFAMRKLSLFAITITMTPITDVSKSKPEVVVDRNN